MSPNGHDAYPSICSACGGHIPYREHLWHFGLGVLFFALVMLGFDALFAGSRGHACYTDATCDPSFVCVQVASERGTCFELQNLKINGFPWKVRR